MDEVGAVIQELKTLAKRYRVLTGKSLGITAEVGEYEATRLRGLELCADREPGYDALWKREGKTLRVQIKSRLLPQGEELGRLGKIDLTKEWDMLLFILLDEDFEPVSIHKAERKDVDQMLKRPGSKARKVREQPEVSQLLAISRQVWAKK
ncbi:MAG: hypothetical protein ACE5K9_00060 [Candidatus Methylomirabilales bacterium]